MQYHDGAMRLAAWDCGPSQENAAFVESLEHQLRIQLPASFRELACSSAWPGILKAFSNSDHPVRLENLGTPWSSGYEPLADHVLPFMTENQGVCHWAIRLDGTDDPEVLVEVDSGPPPDWKYCAASFSSWLWCQVHDTQLCEAAFFGAFGTRIVPGAIPALEKVLRIGPITHGWPMRFTRRSSCSLGRVLVHYDDQHADWWIEPTDASTAEELLSMLPIGLRSLDCFGPEAKALLARLRNTVSST